MTEFIRLTLVVICVLLAGVAHGQSELERHLGLAISDRLLTRLTNPKGSDYRVGMVNTAAGTGMLISGKDSHSVVEFIRGYSSEEGSDWTLHWSAIEQVAVPLPEEFHFEIIRRRIDSENCASLQSSIRDFYTELEQSLSAAMTSLSREPRPLEPLREISVDGTTFPIQIWTGREKITVDVDRDRNTSLHSASKQLHMTVSGCANEATGEIEKHYTWID